MPEGTCTLQCKKKTYPQVIGLSIITKTFLPTETINLSAIFKRFQSTTPQQVNRKFFCGEQNENNKRNKKSSSMSDFEPYVYRRSITLWEKHLSNIDMKGIKKV